MKKVRKLSSLVVIVFFISGAWAAERSAIHWLFFNSPGAMDLQNKDIPEGYMGEIYQILKEKLPEYDHQIVEMPFARVLERIKKKTNNCSLLILKTPEREEFLYFSDSFYPGMKMGVIYANDNPRVKKYVDKSNRVDIKKLLADKSVVVGIISARFYGESIRESLQRRAGLNVVEKRGIESSEELRLMLIKNRIDIYFGFYPERVIDDKYTFSFLKDNPALLVPRVSCEKTAFGKEVIQKANMIFKDPKIRQRLKLIQAQYKSL